MNNLHTRTNRLTDAQQKEWWAANADLLKRDRAAEKEGQRPLWGASEISGLGYMEGETAPKARNAYGYDLDEWYAGNWSPRQAPGQTEGYTTQGLIQTATIDKTDKSAWLELDKKELKARARMARQMMAAKGAEQAEPWQGAIKESEGHHTPQKGEQTWADTCGDLAITIPSWMGQSSPLNWREEKESNRCLAMTRRTYSDTTWTLEEAEPIWWNRHNKGRILAGDIGAARIDTNKYGKKIAALEKQLKAALADKGRRSNGPIMSLGERWPGIANPEDLIRDNTDEERRNYEALAESLAKWITSKEMEMLICRANGQAIRDRHMLKRAITKAKAALA